MKIYSLGGARDLISCTSQNKTDSSYPLSDIGESVLGRDIIHMTTMGKALAFFMALLFKQTVQP